MAALFDEFGDYRPFQRRGHHDALDGPRRLPRYECDHISNVILSHLHRITELRCHEYNGQDRHRTGMALAHHPLRGIENATADQPANEATRMAAAGTSR